MSTQQKFTPWYPGHVQPAHRGLYQRRYSQVGDYATYSLWDGRKWRNSMHDPKLAAKELRPSIYQCLEWRGIAEKPEAA